MIVGIGWGVMLSAIGDKQVVGQIEAALMPLNVETIFFTLLTLSAFLYFIFYKLPEGSALETVHGYIRIFGRWAILAMMGITFGNMILGRAGILINAFADLFIRYLPQLLGL
jgi:hypothetical protein